MCAAALACDEMGLAIGLREDIDGASFRHAKFMVSRDETTFSRALKTLGYVKHTARPSHLAHNA